MKILIVGAGAVGQVYGTHLKNSGAYVAVFVKPKYVESCQHGLTIYRHHFFSRHTVEVFQPDDVISELKVVAAQRWDQVWLCVPTSALEDQWIKNIFEAIGDATVVCPQPGMHVFERITKYVPPQQIVSATIGFISYQAPLPNEAFDPGVAYLFPPFGSTKLSGHPDRVDPVVAALRRGHCPARVHRDARMMLMFASAFLMPHMTALEAAGWSFEDLRHGPWLKLASLACIEAMQVTAVRFNLGLPWWRVCVQPMIIRIATLVIPMLLPFDMEKYMKFHFTKISVQNQIVMQDFYDAARQYGIEAPALTELYERVHI